MAGWDRNEARAEVWPDVAAVLDSWRSEVNSADPPAVAP